MILPAILRSLHTPRSACAAALLVCLLAGCHSTRLGEICSDTHDDQPLAVVASFGQPAAVADTLRTDVPTPEPALQTVAYQEVEPATPSQPIDFETALRLGGADNPTIALAEVAVRARQAEQMQARALLLPTLNVGANLRLHRGNLLTSAGVIENVNTQSLYWGTGADAKGAGTVAVPGVRLVTHLAEAYFAPQAAQQKLVQSRFDAVATRHYTLLEIGVRYLALVDAQASAAAYRQSLKDVGEVERLTTNHAKAGQGRESDAERARSEAMLLRAEAQRAAEAQGVAAAELARLLDLDPALSLRAADDVPPLIELVDRQLPLEALLDQALAAHPEIVARSADVSFQAIRVRQERARVWLPLVVVGFSAGEFGGGNQSSNPRIQNFSPRTDLDVALVWSLQNLSVGNGATQNAVRSEFEQAQLDHLRLLDRIRREIADAWTLTQQRSQEIELAQKRVEVSQRAYVEDLTRIRNLKGLPLEVLQSATQLAAARQDLVRARIGYSQAQLQLYTALGNPPALPSARN